MPGDIDGILLGNALALVKVGDGCLLLDELSVWDTRMVDIVDEGLEKKDSA